MFDGQGFYSYIAMIGRDRGMRGGEAARIAVVGRGYEPRLSHKNVLSSTYILPRFLGRLPAYLS